MTPQTKNSLVAAGFALLAIGRALYPKPVWNRWTREPFDNQLLARIVYAAVGLYMLWAGYSLYTRPH